MAVLRSYVSIDMLSDYLPISEQAIDNATITIATTSHIQAVSGNEVLNIYGKFVYTGAGSAVVTKFNFKTSGSTVLEMSGLNWDILSDNPNVDEDSYILRKADTIIGSDFDDILLGYAGNDTILGGAGDDELHGGSGSDTASYNTATSSVTVDLSITGFQDTGAAGLDSLNSIENLKGSDYNDQLIGDSGDNTLKGGDGDDELQGGLGNDTLIGGAGIDTASYSDAIGSVKVNLKKDKAQVAASSTKDLLIEIENATGSSYADKLKGNDADNVLSGGLGDDLLIGGAGNDVLNGGAGTDTADYSKEKQGVQVDLSVAGAQDTGAGLDQLIEIENLIGTKYHDTLTGDNEDNVFKGGLGNDVLDGGAGSDTVDYSDSLGAVTVDLRITGAQNTGDLGNDQLNNIENIIGSASKDILIGDAANNIFYGGDHKDLLIGGAGDDELHGGAGNDTLAGGEGINYLYGGSGKDKFFLEDGVSNILDFSLLEGDKIQLDFNVYSELSSTDKVLDGFSFTTSETLDFNDVLSSSAILYESGTGDIYYDANGGTGFDAVHIASVTTGILLENTNFEVI